MFAFPALSHQKIDAFSLETQIPNKLKGYVPIFPPCLIKKLTLFPSKPKTQTSS